MRKALGIFALLALLVMGGSPVHADTASQSTGVIVPLYTGPGQVWQELINEALQYPAVRIVAIVNIQYGPGWPMDPSYVQPIKDLQAAGITVIGYVWTGYGTEGLSDWVFILAQEWRDWYNLTGLYLDGMSNTPGEEWYYQSITQYAHSIGESLVIGNPGTSVSWGYLGTVDSIITYESPGLPTVSWLSQYPYQPKSDFGYIAYSAGFNSSAILATSQYVGFLYVTDASFPNPYTVLPSYFSQLLGLLNSFGSVTMNIIAMSDSTGEIYGMYILAITGNSWQSCWSPCSFTFPYGSVHQIIPESYGIWNFEGWQHGPDPETLIAVYS